MAFRKDFGQPNQNIVATFDANTGSARIFDEKTVTDKVPEPESPESENVEASELSTEHKEAKYQHAPASTEELSEEDRPFDPRREITLEEAQKIKPDAKLGDVMRTELEVPGAFGRMAAQTAKQVIIQKLREAERETIFEEYKDRTDTLVNGSIQRIEGRMVIVDIGHASALMPAQEQIRGEVYRPGSRLKFYIASVTQTSKGPEIIVSRAAKQLVAKMFMMEVPELESGMIEIKAVAREAGSRTKIAVFSNDSSIDPVGSCVGQRGTRVQTVISEIGGEKIDIIEWDADATRFISNALSPAKVLNVTLNEEEHKATVEVKDDQLSLAIGRAGQNVRLSSNLTGWRIDIVGETATQTPEATVEPTSEEASSTPAAETADGTNEAVKKEEGSLDEKSNGGDSEITAQSEEAAESGSEKPSVSATEGSDQSSNS